MPETTMNEDHLLPAWKNQIRAARELPSMEPESIPKCMSDAANRYFRTGVLAADPPHIVASPFLVDLVQPASPSCSVDLQGFSIKESMKPSLTPAIFRRRHNE